MIAKPSQENLKRAVLPPVCTKEWWEFISLGLPGTAMLCSEWWAFEATVIMAGFLGTEQVAAQVIILQVASLAFMVPLGLGIAGCTIVGNALGASKRPLAINMADLAIRSIIGLEFGVAAIIMLVGKWYVRLFTDDEDVLYHSDRMIPFLAFFTFFSSPDVPLDGDFLVDVFARSLQNVQARHLQTANTRSQTA